jgi:hypothetical protein
MVSNFIVYISFLYLSLDFKALLVKNSINIAAYFLLHLDMWVKCTSGCDMVS